MAFIPVAGSSGQVLFNGGNRLLLAADSNLSWDNSGKELSVSNINIGTIFGQGSDGSMLCKGEIRMTDNGSVVTLFGVSHTNPLNRAFAADSPGDVDNRFSIDGNGQLQWGPGSSSRDTNLFRAAAATLQTNGNFTVHVDTDRNFGVLPATLGGVEFTFFRSVNDAANSTEPLAIQGSQVVLGAAIGGGNVGINVINPGVALDISGSTRIAGAGLQMGSPTGGDKGAGTINVASGIYLNNTLYTNPDYVFEQAYTGKIEKFASNPGAKEYVPMSLEETEAYAKEHHQLPRVGDKQELFSRTDILLEKVEELYLHMFEMSKSIKKLQAENTVLKAQVDALKGRL